MNFLIFTGYANAIINLKSSMTVFGYDIHVIQMIINYNPETLVCVVLCIQLPNNENNNMILNMICENE